MSHGMGSRPVDWMKVLREQKSLEGLRVTVGLTPLEHLRWIDLTQKLKRQFPGKPVPTAKGRKTRLRVDFRDPEEFEEARIHDLPRGGVFIATPFVAEIGTEFDLGISIRSIDASLALPCKVASHHVGDGFSTQSFGMGVVWTSLSEEQLAELEAVEKLSHVRARRRRKR